MDGDGWLQQGVHWSPARGPNCLANRDLDSVLCGGHHAKDTMVYRFSDFFSHLSVFLLSVFNKLILYISSILRQLSTMLSNAHYTDDKNLLAHPNCGFRCYLHLSMVV